MRDPQVMHGWMTLGMTLGFGLAILINCFWVWLALSLCRLKASFGGMCMISAANILPAALLAPSYGWACSLGLMAVTVRSVTDSERWIDSIKFVVASMLISLSIALLLMKLVFGTINFSEIVKQHANASISSSQQDSAEEQTPPSHGIDALRSKLSPKELADIQRQVEEPLETNETTAAQGGSPSK